MLKKVGREEILSKMTGNGGFTRAVLAEWGVPWPPPAGWRAALEGGFPIPVHKAFDPVERVQMLLSQIGAYADPGQTIVVMVRGVELKVETAPIG